MSQFTAFHGNDRFRLIRPIGEGGMGVVYKVYDRQRDETVALKRVLNLNPHSRLRLKREFRALHDLSHPNMVQLGELIDENGDLFFTMEFIDGEDLISFVQSDFHKTDKAIRETQSAEREKVTTESMEAISPLQYALPKSISTRPLVFDEIRLRLAFAQLVQGLSALHEAGKIHRDIKPPNVIVSPAEPRVVLLDFGLVLDQEKHQSITAGSAVGTAAYMSPEQAASKPLTEASDWYSVGVMLFEALTGRLPFSGTNVEILLEKQNRTPPPPSAFVKGVPPDLDELCVDLLQRDPKARPDAARIFRYFALDEKPIPTRITSHRSLDLGPFIGRKEELKALRDAFETTRNGTPVIFVLEGPSGTGKSELARHFCLRCCTEDESTAVLTNRCYERESLHYKAFDEIADALAYRLSRLPDHLSHRLVPSHAALLEHLFPVFGRVNAVAQAPVEDLSGLEPQEIRRKMFLTFRELLVRAAEMGPLILCIDDFHFADPDSLALLRELMMPPRAPQALVIVTMGAQAQASFDWSEFQKDGIQFRRVTLGNLAADEVNSLLTQLTPDLNNDLRRRILEESSGHPLFIRELIEHINEQSEPHHWDLKSVIEARLAGFPEDSQTLLKLLSVDGGRVPAEVLQEASGLPKRRFATSLFNIRNQSFAKQASYGNNEAITLYHPRLGTLIRNALNRSETKALHRKLAMAYRQTGAATAQPHGVVRHLVAAGERARAAKYAEDAAGKAGKALAFGNSADLFRSALALGDHAGASLANLQFKLAEALTNSGRSRAAADVFAQIEEAELPDLTYRARLAAARQYLRSGHIVEGLKAADRLMQLIGDRLPRSPFFSILSVLWYRFLVTLHGLKPKPQRKRKRLFEHKEIARLDTYNEVAQALSLVDPILSSVLQARALWLAVRMGEATRLTRAMIFEAVFSAVRQKYKRGSELMAIASETAAELNSHELEGLISLGRGVTSAIRGDYRQVPHFMKKAEAEFRQTDNETYWELASARWIRLQGLRYTGDIKTVSELFKEYMLVASRNGDRYLATMLVRTSGSLVWLSQDQPNELRDALERHAWSAPTDSVHIQHMYDWAARAELALYQGEATHFLKVSKHERQRLQGSLLARVGRYRVVLAWTYGRLLAATCQETQNPKGLAEVEQLGHFLMENGGEMGSVFGLIFHGQTLLIEGREKEAKIKLFEALDLAKRMELRLYVTAIRALLADQCAEEIASIYIAKDRPWLKEQGVLNAHHLLRMLIPAIRDTPDPDVSPS